MKKLTLLLIAFAMIFATAGITNADYMIKQCKNVQVLACVSNNKNIDKLIARLEFQKNRQGLSCDYDVLNLEQELKKDIEKLFDGYKKTIKVCENVLVKSSVNVTWKVPKIVQ
jgi:flagellar motility protein MotE (MotC chaperone)